MPSVISSAYPRKSLKPNKLNAKNSLFFSLDKFAFTVINIGKINKEKIITTAYNTIYLIFALTIFIYKKAPHLAVLLMIKFIEVKTFQFPRL